MGYNDLSESALTPDERVAEKDRIMSIFIDIGYSNCSQKEREFLNQMRTARFVSVKQLLYMRDIKDRCL